MAKRTVIIKFEFSNSEEVIVDINTDKVPLSLIVEHLQNLSKAFSTQIVNDAKEVVSEKELESYLNARIKVDKEILNKLIKDKIWPL